LKFDLIINAVDGCVTGVMMSSLPAEHTNDGCRLFGYFGQVTLKNTVKMYGFNSSGKFETCEKCAIAKAQQKSVSKNWLGSSIFLVSFYTLISVPLKKVVLEEPSSRPLFLMTIHTIVQAMFLKKGLILNVK
jgi:hypothetical protein